MSNPKLVREVQRGVEQLLRDAGVEQWDVIQTRRGHFRIEFYRDGKPRSIAFCGSGDWRARKNTLAQTKRVLNGAPA